MTESAATLAGHRAMCARASLPAWGAWHADVQIDGEITLTGKVDLVIADLTLRGTVLSGGPSKGRSDFRIVGGAGGWGKKIPAKSYANDAGVKLATVLGDAAVESGETIDLGTRGDERVGPSFTRPEGPASRVLELLAPSAWYVGEDGGTRLGRRPAASYTGTGTHGVVDRARGTVTLAAEQIATLVPGVTVDALEAVDVEHEISAKGGLRSTIWGRQGTGTSRRLSAMRAIAEQLDPDRKFRGLTEYRVVDLEGQRLNLQPVRVSTGMPDLRRVLARPGVPGCYGAAALGSRVLVGFANSEPGRPFVAAFEDAEGDGFQPTSLTLSAGSMAPTEHVMTVEATALLIYNVLVALMAAAGGGPLLAAVLQPLLATAVGAALTAQAAPAPPGVIAQSTLNATLQAAFAAGTTPSPTTFAAWDAAIALLSTKTSDETGQFPSLGVPKVKVG